MYRNTNAHAGFDIYKQALYTYLFSLPAFMYTWQWNSVNSCGLKWGEYSTGQAYLATYIKGEHTMATTGELRAIIADLELVEIGDAASYLGEEEEEQSTVFISPEPLTEKHTDTCNCISCQLLRS